MNLTESQRERLIYLMEEAAEVQQAAAKILRHGYENHHPREPSAKNYENLETEMGHLLLAMRLLTYTEDARRGTILERMRLKAKRIKYLYHQDRALINKAGGVS